MTSKIDSDFARQLLSGLKSATMSEQDSGKAEILAALDKLGSLTVKDDSITFDGDRIQLPARFDGDLLGAARFIEMIHEQEEEEFAFNRTFKFRPWDGAAAFQRALYRVFGTVGLGKSVQTMFGKRPPQLISIAVDANENIQVPWGRVSMPALDATFDLGGEYDEEYGSLFNVNVTAPRKQRKRIEAFFGVVQDELEQRSIYKGKAFNGADMP